MCKRRKRTERVLDDCSVIYPATMSLLGQPLLARVGFDLSNGVHFIHDGASMDEPGGEVKTEELVSVMKWYQRKLTQG